VVGPFQRRDVALERLSRGVLAARILVALMLTKGIVDVRARLVDGRHDRTRQQIRTLASVDSAGREAPVGVGVSTAGHRQSGKRARVQVNGRSDPYTGGRR